MDKIVLALKKKFLLPEEGSSGKFSEEGFSGRTICSSGRRFFRMNNLFYRNNLLPEKLPEEGSSG